LRVSPSDVACSDGAYCNGEERVPSSGGCVAGQAPICEDGFACTADSCDETNDTCAHQPNDAACQNGTFCDGVEKCAVGQGCIDQADVSCADDGVTCTLSRLAASSCLASTLDNTKCRAGEFCSFGGCVTGTAARTTPSAATASPATASGLRHGTNPGRHACGRELQRLHQCTFDQCQEPTGACDHAVRSFCATGRVRRLGSAIW
jgi:hypothetical protein